MSKGNTPIKSKEKRRMLKYFMEIQDSKCYYCKCKCFIGTIEQRINQEQYRNIATIEHILPPGSPKRNYKENLVMACLECNTLRGIYQRSKMILSNQNKYHHPCNGNKNRSTDHTGSNQ